MTEQEEKFLNDILAAVETWKPKHTINYDYCGAGDRHFCIDIEINMGDWECSSSKIWDALSEVCDNWGAGLDSYSRTYSIAIKF